MKKRVVAVLLSLSMCMATAAEATVASAADFSAEITAAEDNDESVADETADSQDVEDSTVTIETVKYLMKNRMMQRQHRKQMWQMQLIQRMK